MDHENTHDNCNSCYGFRHNSSIPNSVLMNLVANVSEAGLTYRLKSGALHRLEIFTLQDLLFHLPFRYEDYTNSVQLSKLQPEVVSVIKGKVLEIKNEYTRRRFVIQKATITDGNINLNCMWFNQPYITRIIHPEDTVGLVGKFEVKEGKKVFQVKDYEVLSTSRGIHTYLLNG